MELLQAELSEYAERSNRPAPDQDPFLTLWAEWKEAEEQTRRHAALAQALRKRLDKMAEPQIQARIVRLTSERLHDFPAPEETLYGVACSSPRSALVVYGRPRRSPEKV